MKCLVIILLFTNSFFSYGNDSTKVDKSDVIEKLQDDIKEIRRDQLNYKIEKEILQETYSSNYSSIQLIITLILALFTVLGYFGITGITNLKKEYALELARLVELKGSFERSLDDLMKYQEKIKDQLKSIDNLNEEQNKKIKLIEIKEKTNSFYTKQNFQRALDYSAIGLELKGDDNELLGIRAYSLFKLKNFGQALEAHKTAYQNDPTDQNMARNLAELYLLVGQVDNYKEFIKEKIELVKSHSEGLFTYFEVTRFYLENKGGIMIETIKNFVNREDPMISKNYLGSWDLTEFYQVMNAKPSSTEKTIVINFASYLKGGMMGKQLLELIG